MDHPGFFERAGPFPLAGIARDAGAELPDGADGTREVVSLAPIDTARPTDVTFLDNRKYLGALATTRAAACFIAPAFASRVPAATVALTTPEPYRAFALALRRFYPTAGRPVVAQGMTGGMHVHPTARLEEGVAVEPGAVIGPEARIGSGTVIAAGAVVGYRVAIGRDGFVGPNASVVHALIGDRVIIHGGAQIGHDGFGFAMGAKGHLKVPQIGRVIIQDDVEIGANTTVDRGALKDTVIGEGTKIDNLVQIGHNCVVGRHCILCGQAALSGSTVLGDFVVMGGNSGTVGHIAVGSGAQIAGKSGASGDVPAGAKFGGVPARPLSEWAREIATLKRLAARKGGEPGT